MLAEGNVTRWTARFEEILEEAIQKRIHMNEQFIDDRFDYFISDEVKFFVDYRELNVITDKNKYVSSRFFMKLDIIAVFNQIHIAEKHEWITAFKTRCDLYKYLMISFELHDGPTRFQECINQQLQNYLNTFCLAYMNDIFIYSSIRAEYQQYVKLVLRAASLQLNINKCKFHKEEILYLNIPIKRNKMRMNLIKVDAIKSWLKSQNKKDIQAFIDFVNFYRRFIASFFKIAAPLIAFNSTWNWINACDETFEDLKHMFCFASILTLYNFDEDCLIKKIAFDYVFVDVLFPKDLDDLIQSVIYFSKKHMFARCNYEIYDKELLVIILTFQKWKPKLKSSSNEIQVYSDHWNLKWFMIIKQLNKSHIKWTEYFFISNFKINYHSKRLKIKSNAFTRWTKYLSTNEISRRDHQMQVVLKSHNIIMLKEIKQKKQVSPNQTFADAYDENDSAIEIFNLLRKK